MEIDNRLIDKIGMIADGGDTVGTTCKYSMVYGIRKLLDLIDFYLIWVRFERCYNFWRSYDHRVKKLNTQSRDHVYWLKIASLFHKTKLFDHYFESLKPFGKISEKYRMTLDLYWFVNGYNFLWQLWMLISVFFGWGWNSFWFLVGGLKQVQPHEYSYKTRIYDNGKRITNIRQLCKYRKNVQFLDWTFIEYYIANMFPKYPSYVITQNAWALSVSKPIPVITKAIQSILRKMTWKDNPEIYLLTGKHSDHDITGFMDEVCNKYMNQTYVPDIKEEYKCLIFKDTIEFLKYK
jgi:hypothetical protein